MEDILITSSKKRENSFDNELCKISMNDLNRLAYFTLSLKPTEEDSDVSLATSYCNTLERYFRENSEDDNLNDLRDIYKNIKDDMIVKMLFVQNIELMILRSNINNTESYNEYVEALEEFAKSINGNEFQKKANDFDDSFQKVK